MEIFKQTNFDFLGKKWPFIIASLLLTVAGAVSLIMKGGPRYGIDFKGGTVTIVRFAQTTNEEAIRRALNQKIPGEIIVQQDKTNNEVIISTELRDEKALAESRNVVVSTLAQNFGNTGNGKLDVNNTGQAVLANRLREPLVRANANLSDQQLEDLSKAILQFRDTAPNSGLIGNLDQLSAVSGVTPQVLNVIKQETFPAGYAIRGFNLVGPKVGGELRTQALNATLLALAGMLAYVAFRFELIYGLAAVIAVFHDTFITLGLFSIFDKPIDLTVIAALLTLVGFSMNDTIVVFDRIRENLPQMRKEKFETIVNLSVNQTLSRTILTSGLTFLTALSLWMFGGQVLNGFSFALVIGILIGTYSSIFVASPILVFWKRRSDEKRKSSVAVPVRSASVK